MRELTAAVTVDPETGRLHDESKVFVDGRVADVPTWTEDGSAGNAWRIIEALRSLGFEPVPLTSRQIIGDLQLLYVQSIPGHPESAEPCPFTFAHTRHWCGNPTCRER